MSKVNIKTKIAITLTVAIILVFGFMFGKEDIAVVEKIDETETSETIKYTQLEFPENDLDTSDWETYRNEDFGFEVRYPRDWEIQFSDFHNMNVTFDDSHKKLPNKSFLSLLLPNEQYINIFDTQFSSLEKEIENIKTSHLSPKTKIKQYIKVNNTFGIKIGLTDNEMKLLGFKVLDSYILAGRNNITYRFSNSNEPNTDKYLLELQKILLSFKLFQ